MLKTRLTMEEYDRLTEDDPRRTELIDGELVIVTDPRYGHARLQAQLAQALGVWGDESGRAEVAGPTTVRLTERDSYGPDLVVVPARPTLNDRGRLAAPPLICVEIRSPSTWRYDIGRKKTVYEAHGVPELWLVDGIGAELLVFRRSHPDAPDYDLALELTRDDVLSSPLLPGFELPLDRLFSA